MDLKPNKGIIFKNTKKTSDKHPDYRGEVNIETPGLKEISLWVNTDKNGKMYFSVGISEPYRGPIPEAVNGFIDRHLPAEPPAGKYERQGIYDKPIDKESIQDDTPTDTNDLPF